MKFLVDAQLPRRIVRELAAHGHDTVHTSDLPAANRTQDYLGADKKYYEPTEQGVEKKIKERVEKWRAQFVEKRKATDGC